MELHNTSSSASLSRMPSFEEVGSQESLPQEEGSSAQAPPIVPDRRRHSIVSRAQIIQRAGNHLLNKVYPLRVLANGVFEKLGKPGGEEVFNRLFTTLNLGSAEALYPLSLFAFHYLEKAGGWDPERAIHFHRPVSFLNENAEQPAYHREYKKQNTILKTATEEIKKDLISNDHMHPQMWVAIVHDASILETIRMHSHVMEVEADIGTITSTFDKISSEELASSMYVFLTSPGEHSELSGLLDSMDFLNQIKEEEKTIYFPSASVETSEVELKASETKMETSEAEIEGSEAEMEACKSKWKNFIILYAEEKHGVTVLFSPNMTLKAEKFISDKVRCGGHAPTMLQAKSVCLSIDPKYMKNKKSGPLSRRLSEWVTPYKNIEEFLRRETIERYADLPRQGNQGRELVIDANMRLLQGIRELNLDQFLREPNDERCQAIQMSLDRIIALLKKSTKNYENEIIFNLCHDLLSEEYLLLLNIARPQLDFQKIYLENLKNMEGREEITVQPLVLAFPSGIACADATLRAMHGLYSQECLEVGYVRDSYFETSQLFEAAPGYVNDSLNFTPYEVEQNDLTASQQTVLPHLFYTDIHPSPSIHREEYSARDISQNINSLLSQRSTNASPVTVAIDITLNALNSLEVNDLLNQYSEEIEQGDLNIILYRSAQKFDQLGTDKFNAGYMEVYSNDERFNQAFAEVTGQLNPLGLDYCALSFYHKHCNEQISEYLDLHVQNAQTIYSCLSEIFSDPESFLGITRMDDPGLYYIEFVYPFYRDAHTNAQQELKAAEKDLEAVQKELIERSEEQIDNKQESSEDQTLSKAKENVRLAEEKLNSAAGEQKFFQEKLMELVYRKGIEKGVLINYRDSFGFTESVICMIEDAKIRLSPGIHTAENLQKITDILIETNQGLVELKKELEQQGIMEEELAKAINKRLKTFLDQL